MTDQQPDALNAPTVPTEPTSIITPSDDSDSATDERAGTPILPDDAYTDDEDTETAPAMVRTLHTARLGSRAVTHVCFCCARVLFTFCNTRAFCLLGAFTLDGSHDVLFYSLFLDANADHITAITAVARASGCKSRLL